MLAGFRPRITFAVVAVLVAVTAAVAYAGPDDVPALTNLTATPKRFCAKRSDTCGNPGTTLRFRLSTPAKVIADIRPRHSNIGGFHEFTKRFPAGASSIRVYDSRLTTGRWTFKLQPVNSVGANGPTLVDVNVVK
ncbi:MAG TPA: hypothetical protein VJT75_08800 [Thermoleophilaceae bacterium]|nr:hypothetical protein [Thermoleophilaceae bacterium]